MYMRPHVVVAAAVLILWAGCAGRPSDPSASDTVEKELGLAAWRIDNPDVGVAYFACETSKVSQPVPISVRRGGGPYPGAPYGDAVYFRQVNLSDPTKSNSWTLVREDDASFGSLGVSASHEGATVERHQEIPTPAISSGADDSLSLELCDADGGKFREELVVLRFGGDGVRGFKASIGRVEPNLTLWWSGGAAVRTWSSEDISNGTSVTVDHIVGAPRATLDGVIEIQAGGPTADCREVVWFNPKAFTGTSETDVGGSTVAEAWVSPPNGDLVHVTAGSHFVSFLDIGGKWSFVVDGSVAADLGNSPILVSACIPRNDN